MNSLATVVESDGFVCDLRRGRPAGHGLRSRTPHWMAWRKLARWQSVLGRGLHRPRRWLRPFSVDGRTSLPGTSSADTHDQQNHTCQTDKSSTTSKGRGSVRARGCSSIGFNAELKNPRQWLRRCAHWTRAACSGLLRNIMTPLRYQNIFHIHGIAQRRSSAAMQSEARTHLPC